MFAECTCWLPGSTCRCAEGAAPWTYYYYKVFAVGLPLTSAGINPCDPDELVGEVPVLLLLIPSILFIFRAKI